MIIKPIKFLLFLIIIFLFSSFAFADEEQYVIVKSNLSAPEEIGGQSKYDIRAGGVYRLQEIVSDETKSVSYYKLVDSSENIFFVNANSANILKEKFSIDKMAQIGLSWVKNNKVSSLKELRGKFEALKSESENWQFQSPYEYQVAKFIGLLEVGRNLELKKNSGLTWKQFVSFYDEVRTSLLGYIDKVDIDSQAYSLIICALLEENPDILSSSKEDFSLAKAAFERFSSEKSANCLLQKLENSPDDVNQELIDKLVKCIGLNSFNETILGNFYYDTNKKELAASYYELADNFSAREKPLD